MIDILKSIFSKIDFIDKSTVIYNICFYLDSIHNFINIKFDFDIARRSRLRSGITFIDSNPEIVDRSRTKYSIYPIIKDILNLSGLTTKNFRDVREIEINKTNISLQILYSEIFPEYRPDQSGYEDVVIPEKLSDGDLELFKQRTNEFNEAINYTIKDASRFNTIYNPYTTTTNTYDLAGQSNTTTTRAEISGEPVGFWQ